jgi:hypothetical protein
VYIALCTLVTLAAAILPRDRVLLAACITTFAGFVIAAVWDIAGF